MTNTLKILYWENDTTVEREVAMGDTNKMGDDVQIPKNNVLAMAFSTKVQGQDTRVRYLEKNDLYMCSMNNETNVDSMYGWDDNDGGWYNRGNPLANDGYVRDSTQEPRLRPYNSFNRLNYIFEGIMLTQQEWDSTAQARDDLR